MIYLLLLLIVLGCIAYSMKHAHKLDDNDEEGIRYFQFQDTASFLMLIFSFWE